MSFCFCEAIPQIDNRTDILIIQHARERYHAFNTARIVQQALSRCELISDYPQQFASLHLPIQANAGLLYPVDDATPLDELPADKRPKQLVVVDGTWHHAKTIFRDVPQLRGLPCYRLNPDQPGQYRIRREPNAQSLSTLEAVAAALNALEPETDGLPQLIMAFNKMIEDQLGHPASHAVWRRRKTRHSRPRNLPVSLMQTPECLVVAYGESTPSRPARSGAGQGAPRGDATVQRARSKVLPVNWVARRLTTSEQFSCLLKQQEPLPDVSLSHMQLSAEDFADAVTLAEFRESWNRFLRPNDVLVVYHQRTHRLLQNVEAVLQTPKGTEPSCLVLKSIYGQRLNEADDAKDKVRSQSLEEIIERERLKISDANKTRAELRLEMAVALTEHLRLQGLQST